MARRRSKKEQDFLTYPYTPDRQLEHPSGWCMTNDHDGCKYQFDHGKCGCKCHTQTQKTQQSPTKKRVVTKEVKTVTDQVNDPRPWKKA